MTEEYCSVTKKTRIKNAKRIKNALIARNQYQQAKFPSHGMQRAGNIRTSNSGDELSRLRSEDMKQTGSKESSPSLKRSERIKVRKKSLELSEVQKHEREDLEDQISDTSSISEISSLSSDISKRRTPVSANRYAFKSKRLQELQEKMISEMREDTSMADKGDLGKVRKETTNQQAHTDSESERNNRTPSRRQSKEEDRVHVNDEGQSQEMSVVLKKKRAGSKKTHISRLQAVKNDGETASSSEDEEGRKPLSELRKEIKERQEEPTERVVKKVIKVVKKIRTKSGETKTKVVKIIKKMGVRKKAKVVTGRRRIRCGSCSGCRVLDDCGTCRWCK